MFIRYSRWNPVLAAICSRRETSLCRARQIIGTISDTYRGACRLEKLIMQETRGRLLLLFF